MGIILLFQTLVTDIAIHAVIHGIVVTFDSISMGLDSQGQKVKEMTIKSQR